jgi:hypothetical protein
LPRLASRVHCSKNGISPNGILLLHVTMLIFHRRTGLQLDQFDNVIFKFIDASAWTEIGIVVKIEIKV